MSFHKWMVGLGLAFLMVTVLLVNSILFSARSFQFNLASIAPASQGIVSVDRLKEAEQSIEQVRQGVAIPRAELAQIDQQLRELDAKAEAARNDAVEHRTAIASSVAAIEARNQIVTAQAVSALDDDALIDRVNALAAARLPQADIAAVESARGATAQLNAALDLVDQAEDQRRELVTRQSLLGGQVAGADTQIFAIKQGVVDNYEQYDRIKNEALSLMASSPLGIGAALVQGHPTFLSTILVLLMGLLGAILYLFPAYMSRPTPVTFAEIAVRSIFGMVTALAFYIVANASIAGLAFVPGGSSGDMASAMNPFTVSLIGIVAGIMADDIAKWIHRRGTELLGGNPGVSQVPATPSAQAPGVATGSAGLAHTADAGAGVNPHGGPYDPSVD
jgi:hypothetical protein